MVICSTMAGLGRVTNPIGNALRDSAPPQAESEDSDRPVAMLLHVVLFP